MKYVEALPIKFGENVRNARVKLGMSQEKLALSAGLDRTYISGIERGKRNPSLKNIGRIALAMGITPKDLLNL